MAESRRNKVRNQILLNALIFVCIYLITNLCWLIVQAHHLLFGFYPTGPLLLVSTMQYALGGVFNMIIYSQPKISVLRTTHPEKYSYFQALWLVVKEGIDTPFEEKVQREKKSSLREGCILEGDAIEVV